jgi:hypothetical protein
MIEAIGQYLNKALGALAEFVIARLATVAYWFCNLLGVNGIYCDPVWIRWEFFLICGVLLSVVLRRIATLLSVLALLAAIILMIVSRTVSFPRIPEETIEFSLVAPLQLLIGVIIGQILIWLWARFGLIFRGWVRRKLGLTNEAGGGDVT